MSVKYQDFLIRIQPRKTIVENDQFQFVDDGPPVPYTISVQVDMTKICDQIGRKAAMSKRKVSRAMNGAVIVKATRQLHR